MFIDKAFIEKKAVAIFQSLSTHSFNFQKKKQSDMKSIEASNINNNSNKRKDLFVKLVKTAVENEKQKTTLLENESTAKKNGQESSEKALESRVSVQLEHANSKAVGNQKNQSFSSVTTNKNRFKSEEVRKNWKRVLDFALKKNNYDEQNSVEGSFMLNAHQQVIFASTKESWFYFFFILSIVIILSVLCCCLIYLFFPRFR